MDVGGLLRQARASAALSQRGLAQRAGTSRASLSAYERGVESPTVRQLDRLLAGCGLQLRSALEPLLADVDERVDAMVHAQPDTKAHELSRLAASLDKAGVRWAVDGATALALHGLAVTHRYVSCVVAHDVALQRWLRDVMAKGCDVEGRPYWDSWLEADLATARAYLGEGTFTIAGFVSLRVVEELPAVLTVAVEVPGQLIDRYSQDDDGPREPSTQLLVPVVTAHEVEAAHPAHAEVLARWRDRQSGASCPSGPAGRATDAS